MSLAVEIRRSRGGVHPGRGAVGVLDRLALACPYMFLVFCLTSALFQAWVLPPTMGPDEFVHALRMDMITQGELTGRKIDFGARISAGGTIDPEIKVIEQTFSDIRFHPERKADSRAFVQVQDLHWRDAPEGASFPAAAVYPPFFYLPQSVGLAVGKALDLTVLQSLGLARTGNALACALLGFAGLLIAGRSRLLMFSVLMLPMSVALYASLTADGMLIVTMALACAVLSRAMHQGRPLGRLEVIAVAICLALVSMTKIPYCFAALLLLVASTERRWWRYAATGAVLATSFAWSAWTAVVVQTPITPHHLGIEAGAQGLYLTAHPSAVVSVALNTLNARWLDYAYGFVGVLGWLDTPLPAGLYHAAWFVLGASVLLSLSRGLDRDWRATQVLSAVIALVLFGSIHGALYLGWTKVGASLVEGVQGRYLLPLALILGLCLEGRRSLLGEGRLAARFRALATAAVLLFPLWTILVVEKTLIVRYYLD